MTENLSSSSESLNYFQLFSPSKSLPPLSIDPDFRQKLDNSPPWPPVVSVERPLNVTPRPPDRTAIKSEPSDDKSSRTKDSSLARQGQGNMKSAPKGPKYVMVDVKSPQDCIPDPLYQELVKVTDDHILAGLDLDMAHIRYSELKEHQKVIEWELKKLEREWPSLIESHVASDARLKETCGRVAEEGGPRGFMLINAVQRNRYTSFVGLTQYLPVKSRLQKMGYMI
ncbi:hypothetical protein VNI00_015961 [Paramarasmius palmivorus]|uniref:Uncharacterized protein n=1 Tax=Paramarasmius palmivorus TaxID=297713 RepID=A0AAW0BHD8_9AGAR